MDKHDIIQALQQFAVLLELAGENPFRARSYANAARVLANSTDTLDDLLTGNRLRSLAGIGEGLADGITQLAQHQPLPGFDELSNKIPAGLFDLLKIPGLGTKKVRKLWQSLGVTSLGELEYACLENRLVELEGYGAKTQAKLLAGAKQVAQYARLFRLPYPFQVAQTLTDWLKQEHDFPQVESAGEVRRFAETVREVVLVVVAEPTPLASILTTHPAVEKVLDIADDTIFFQTTRTLTGRIVCTCERQFGVTIARETGTHEFWQAMAEALQHTASAQVFPDEASVFEKLGWSWVPPELRDLEQALVWGQHHAIPELLDWNHIRGVLHNHTTASDGHNTLQEMRAAAQTKGWEYLGIADHSRALAMAHGLDAARLAAQRQEIDHLNAAAEPDMPRLLKGIEVDILGDGTLDLPDDALEPLDYVVASIHARMNMPANEITERIIRAIKNPHVDILGHPTGRLLLAREGYAVDIEQVLRVAAETGTAMELNANPFRLDLDWRWFQRARALGVKIVINPDAHSTTGLDDIFWGVGMARKGVLAPPSVLNTFSADELVAHFQPA